MSLIQALVIAFLQGVTALFPVSSLGHAVVLPALLGWDIQQDSTSFLPFLVVLHLGTAAALLIYFWRDWLGILLAFVGMGPGEERRAQWRLLWLIIVATIPAVVLGFGLEKLLKQLFGAPMVAAFFLIINGGILFAAERLRRRGSGNATLGQLTWLGAFVIGCTQALALIPGISRSGSTMVGGLLLGLHHKESAHFSFLIATPVIFGAAVLEVPKLLHGGPAASIGPVAWIAGAVAGVTAYFSTAFLMRYFGRHDFQALDPFAYYCVAFGLSSLGLLFFLT
jgi:undecaprenyl-diphosphatase